VVEDLLSWQNRPLDRVYPVLLIDAIVVKIRDGQVANRPIYVAMGINLDGERDVLGLWVGPAGGEGAKFWMSLLTELRNRGVQDTFIVCCDGLKGLPDAIRATWPHARFVVFGSGQRRNELIRIRARVRSGRVAAYSAATGPAIVAADRTASSSPAAVTTACKSSARPSTVGRSANDTGSETPVPRWSYVTTVANDNRRSKNTPCTRSDSRRLRS
jgi:Transposase, Mutator family